MSLRNDFSKKVLKDKNILQWIPFICKFIVKDPAKTYLSCFIKAAREELKKNIKDLSLSPKMTALLTNEEQKAINEAEIIRNREMICYHMSLKSLAEFIKTRSKKHAMKAVEWYSKGEKNWKQFVERSKSFVMLNLIARGRR